MTREEEIIIEFESAANQKCSENEKSLIISAMEWADEHPREGLVDIDDVCDYLAKNLGYIETIEDRFEFIDEIRNAFEK